MGTELTKLSSRELGRYKECLDKLLEVLQRLRVDWTEAGKHLEEIRESALYREQYKTWQDFCEQVCAIPKRTADKWIEACQIRQSLGKTCPKITYLPTLLDETDQLKKLPPPERPKAWTEACEDGRPKPANLREAVKRRIPPKPSPEPETLDTDSQVTPRSDPSGQEIPESCECFFDAAEQIDELLVRPLLGLLYQARSLAKEDQGPGYALYRQVSKAVGVGIDGLVKILRPIALPHARGDDGLRLCDVCPEARRKAGKRGHEVKCEFCVGGVLPATYFGEDAGPEDWQKDQLVKRGLWQANMTGAEAARLCAAISMQERWRPKRPKKRKDS